mmetsp:Transcript_18907/g.35049  ORF Transcript_18907/g.35049 Transcript_18907/m.35049 type:complete len:91 (-) Transcript_18907:1288-1560(-)
MVVVIHFVNEFLRDGSDTNVGRQFGPSLLEYFEGLIMMFVPTAMPTAVPTAVSATMTVISMSMSMPMRSEIPFPGGVHVLHLCKHLSLVV